MSREAETWGTPAGSDVADGVVADFEENAAGARGVDEEVEMAAGAGLDLLRDESDALGLERLEGGGNVIDVQRNVVQAFATLREKASDGRVGRGGLEQLDARVAGGDHRGVDLFLVDGFLVQHAETERLIELARRGDAVDGDADVVESGHEYRV